MPVISVHFVVISVSFLVILVILGDFGNSWHPSDRVGHCGLSQVPVSSDCGLWGIILHGMLSLWDTVFSGSLGSRWLFYFSIHVYTFFMLPYHHRRIHCIIYIQFVHSLILSSADRLYIFAYFQMLFNGQDKYAKSYWRLMLFSGCNYEGKFLTFLSREFNFFWSGLRLLSV